MHPELPERDGLDFAARLRRTALTLDAMPPALARSMSVMLPLGGRDDSEVAELAHGIAGELDLLAVVETIPPLVTVRFIRSGLRAIRG